MQAQSEQNLSAENDPTGTNLTSTEITTTTSVTSPATTSSTITTTQQNIPAFCLKLKFNCKLFSSFFLGFTPGTASGQLKSISPNVASKVQQMMPLEGAKMEAAEALEALEMDLSEHPLPSITRHVHCKSV